MHIFYEFFNLVSNSGMLPPDSPIEPRGRMNPGKISDYDPAEMNSKSNTPYSARSQQARVVYDSNVGKGELWRHRLPIGFVWQ